MKKSRFNVDTSKKGKQKRTYKGVTFDSQLELNYYKYHLLPLEEQGEISNIILHPVFLLQQGYIKDGKRILPIKYESDFQYTLKDGTILIVDVKGLPTQEAILKKKIFDYLYPDKNLIWVAYSKIDGGWIEYDKLKKARAKRKKDKLSEENEGDEV